MLTAGHDFWDGVAALGEIHEVTHSAGTLVRVVLGADLPDVVASDGDTSRRLIGGVVNAAAEQVGETVGGTILESVDSLRDRVVVHLMALGRNGSDT